MTTNMIVGQLKSEGEDFEFYPTTDEILEAINKDLLSASKAIHDFRCNDRPRTLASLKEEPDKFENLIIGLKNSEEFGFNWNYSHENQDSEYSYRLDSIIDIGAGDGRVLKFFPSKKQYAVEKALSQAERLIKNNVMLLGYDFFTTTLIDKNFTMLFCNPPYSIYKDFVKKILAEVNARINYLVIPERWEQDNELKRLMKQKGKYEIIGEFNFFDADRQARAKVHLIRIVVQNAEDSFRTWVEENIGEFKTDKKIDLGQFSEESEVNRAIIDRKENLVEIMVDNYNKELETLLHTYRAIGSVDFSLLESLGIDKSHVLARLKDDIKTLKNKYWTTTINLLEDISKRLTYKKRKQILEEITWFKELDFNAMNIRTIVLWVIENYNRFTQEQMVKVYDEITNMEDVKPYKSNENWVKDSWRYTKPIPTKYSLDYRIVVELNIKAFSKYDYLYNNTIRDLCTVANSLGFTVKSFPENELDYEEKIKHEVYLLSGEVLLEYTIHFNGNIHFKLNQKFLKKLNIEVGKIKGWLKAPKDIQDEFDMSKEEAEEFFTTDYLLQIGNIGGILQIGYSA